LKEFFKELFSKKNDISDLRILLSKGTGGNICEGTGGNIWA
jgi:hypothetical protein